MTILKRKKSLEKGTPEVVATSFKKICKDEGNAEDEKEHYKETQTGRSKNDANQRSQVTLEAELVNENEPLTEEEKNIHYKFPKNVMAGRRIREMMNANLKAKFNRRCQEMKTGSEYKTKLVVALAVTLQVIPVILIFI